jgi:hypothetical protein
MPSAIGTRSGPVGAGCRPCAVQLTLTEGAVHTANFPQACRLARRWRRFLQCWDVQYLLPLAAAPPIVIRAEKPEWFGQVRRTVHGGVH